MNGLYNRKTEYTLTNQFEFDLNCSRIISASCTNENTID
jgi:hypothetical protein